jgi:hypothetical protein
VKPGVQEKKKTQTSRTRLTGNRRGLLALAGTTALPGSGDNTRHGGSEDQRTEFVRWSGGKEHALLYLRQPGLE